MIDATPNPIHDLIRSALADLQPRIEIVSHNITTLYNQRVEQEQVLSDLLAQERAYLAALPQDDTDPDE